VIPAPLPRLTEFVGLMTHDCALRAGRDSMKQASQWASLKWHNGH
jgi:hypothetical protein